MINILNIVATLSSAHVCNTTNNEVDVTVETVCASETIISFAAGSNKFNTIPVIILEPTLIRQGRRL